MRELDRCFCPSYILHISKAGHDRVTRRKANGPVRRRESRANLFKLRLRKCQLGAPVDGDKPLAHSPQPLPQASHSWPFKWLLIRSAQQPRARREGTRGEQRRGGGGPSYLNNSVCHECIFHSPCLQSFHWAEPSTEFTEHTLPNR